MTTAEETRTADPTDKRVKRDALDEIQRVLSAAESGNLDERAAVEGFSPKNRKILAAVNTLLDLHTSSSDQPAAPVVNNAASDAGLDAARGAMQDLVQAFGRLAEGDLSVRYLATEDVKSAGQIGQAACTAIDFIANRIIANTVTD